MPEYLKNPCYLLYCAEECKAEGEVMMTGQEGKTVEEKSAAKGKQEAQEEDRKMGGGYEDEDDEDEEVCICFSGLF